MKKLGYVTITARADDATRFEFDVIVDFSEERSITAGLPGYVKRLFKLAGVFTGRPLGRGIEGFYTAHSLANLVHQIYQDTNKYLSIRATRPVGKFRGENIPRSKQNRNH